MKKAFLLFFILIGIFNYSYQSKQKATTHKTKNVIILVIDGPRYSETWGDSTHQYIPRMANNMAPIGIVCSNIYNDGTTNTNNGHTALTTGVYQNMNNSGLEYPQHPSVFQYWLKQTGSSSDLAWVITTKDKLEILSDCTDPNWKGKYRPMRDCGINGLGTGYREDSTTFTHVKNTLSKHHPRLMMINFKQPDAAGHANNWNDYLQGIRDKDEYVFQLWNYLQADSFYKDNTTLFVTNDHGRHLDGVKDQYGDGFISHGDDCLGCRHINLYAIGPDFKSNVIDTNRYSQIDINATAAYLMGVTMPTSKGKVLTNFFK